ncbi:hypothetical protein DRW48_00945 [Paracoccus suum]|uniref:5-bromo-4-chloroindolyl phosphate hydrolysis protein n=1 Tax=Paracoccus suum TaxID=2259340 RepID=A0A344PGF0_9RHOB|nr:5-bromo-4-chloroindolyl phosphate hydrolysis family protein [Paracoccus suum]AXC48455.1 hypothetical protein DRW48_00945 [Paracoccus suum]
MAVRFGGQFSPGAKEPEEASVPLRAAPGHLRHRLESRTAWITAAASPLLMTAFFQDPAGMAANFAGFGIIAAGMMLTREGLQAEAAYDARRVARRPAYPRKLFGGVLTGLGLAIGAAEPGALAGAGIIGLVGGALHWLSFGGDPMRDKGMSDTDAFQQDRIARIIAEAEAHLAAMQTAVQRTGDPAIEDEVARFAATARGLFGRLEDNPTELASARRYLGVWLLGARDATIKFADIFARTRDSASRGAWQALMGDLTTEFAARSARMIEGGRTDMSIEISVLRERLAREGLAAPSGGIDAAAVAPTTAQVEDQRAVTLDELLRTPADKVRQ